MPAFESRRVRTQPFRVTGASCGALPAKILRTLNTLSSISESYHVPIKSQLNGKLHGATMRDALRDVVKIPRMNSESLMAICYSATGERDYDGDWVLGPISAGLVAAQEDNQHY